MSNKYLDYGAEGKGYGISFKVLGLITVVGKLGRRGSNDYDG